MTKKGTATNRDGTGSTYGGTQTPEKNAPDAYQKPPAKAYKKDPIHKEKDTTVAPKKSSKPASKTATATSKAGKK